MHFEAPEDASLADPLPDSPLPLLGRWLDEARERAGQRNPTAMTLATLDEQGHAAARVVLCRGFDAEHGCVVFYSDASSRKGVQLAGVPHAAAVFHWDALERQVRIEGPVEALPEPASDAWFAGRHRPAQIAAWASRQSRPVASRAAMLEQLRATAQRFEGAETIPRPPDWIGYQLRIARVELWVASPRSAHDRVAWHREDLGAPRWSAERLQP